MTNQEKITAPQRTSPAEPKPASADQARDQEVIDDEKEAMRRAKLPRAGDEPVETQNPQVAEIESIIAAVRH